MLQALATFLYRSNEKNPRSNPHSTCFAYEKRLNFSNALTKGQWGTFLTTDAGLANTNKTDFVSTNFTTCKLFEAFGY